MPAALQVEAQPGLLTQADLELTFTTGSTSWYAG
jgi:hypothetical protein